MEETNKPDREGRSAVENGQETGPQVEQDGRENPVVPSPESGKESSLESSGEKKHLYSQILSKIKSNGPGSDDDASVGEEAEILSKMEGAEEKVKKLVDVAQQKGVVYAVKVAKHLEDNYVLDELHDRLLSEELHKALIEKGLIKDI